MLTIRTQGSDYYVAKTNDRKKAEKLLQLWKHWHPEIKWEILPEPVKKIGTVRNKHKIR